MTDTVTVTIDGEARSVPAFTTVAAALAMHGTLATRLSVTAEPRGPLCGMGVCQECRVSVDGRAHVLACQTLCRDGLAILTATGAAR